jgi:hypothetical protein
LDDKIKILTKNLASAASNCGNNANFVTVTKPGVLIIQKSDILAIYIQIEEAAQLAILIAKATPEAGIEGI